MILKYSLPKGLTMNTEITEKFILEVIRWSGYNSCALFEAIFQHSPHIFGDRKQLIKFFYFGCECGELDALKWFHKTFKFTKHELESRQFQENINPLYVACFNGKISVAKWLVDVFSLNLKYCEQVIWKIVEDFGEDKHLETLRWIFHTFTFDRSCFFSFDDSLENITCILSQSCKTGNLSLVKLIVEETGMDFFFDVPNASKIADQNFNYIYEYLVNKFPDMVTI